MRKLYLISTEHLENMVWFRSEDDFRVGMNYVAVLAAEFSKVTVLVFILMSNHVHFVLYGKREDVISFINQFKRRYSQYVRRKYGVREFLRNNKVDVKVIEFADEAPERAYAYVQMNCVAANICSHPCQYPWGTGNVFFNPSLKKDGIRVGDMSGRALKRMLHSEGISLPDDWIVSGDGYILPESYVNVKAVEDCFKTPQRLDYFYRNSSKAKMRLESTDSNLPSFRDQIILPAVNELCRTLFDKKSFEMLSINEQVEILRQLRFRFSADTHQLARVCGLSYKEVSRLLDNV